MTLLVASADDVGPTGGNSWRANFSSLIVSGPETISPYAAVPGALRGRTAVDSALAIAGRRNSVPTRRLLRMLDLEKSTERASQGQLSPDPRFPPLATLVRSLWNDLARLAHSPS